MFEKYDTLAFIGFVFNTCIWIILIYYIASVVFLFLFLSRSDGTLFEPRSYLEGKRELEICYDSNEEKLNISDTKTSKTIEFVQY